MKISEEMKAKHVFGQLTLEDIWPFVKGCSLVYVTKDGQEIRYTEFNWWEDEDGRGLYLWHDEKAMDVDFFFASTAMVRVKDGIVEIHDDGVLELQFFRIEPIKIEILKKSGSAL